MNSGMIGVIIVLVLLIVLVGAIYYGVMYLRKKLKTYSRLFFGTESISEGLKKTEMEYATTPKSVAGATSLYMPQIMRDFPEFHLEEMKERAENVLTSYLQCIDAKNPALLAEGTNELKDKLRIKIAGLTNEDSSEHFERIKIHKTEVNKYRKEKGRCSVVFQSAVGYVHYVEKNGKVITGRKERLEQSKYNVEVSYIQNRDVVENLGDSGLALNCPRCGAPLESLGAKICMYCDSPVMEFNIRTWNFTDVQALK